MRRTPTIHRFRAASLLTALCLPAAGCDDAADLAADEPGAGGKADEAEQDEDNQALDLIAWDRAHPEHESLLGGWAAARLHADRDALERTYDPQADLSIVDAAELADDRDGIEAYYDAERQCFDEHRLEHLWAFEHSRLFVSAIVERVSGTLSDDPTGCPLIGEVEPEIAAGQFVAFHRLVIIEHQLLDVVGSGMNVRQEILAYDESTVPGQLTGAQDVRSADDRPDFGEPMVHLGRFDEGIAAPIELVQSFNRAFDDEDIEGTVAFLDAEACEGPCVTDLTFATDFDRGEFGGLLEGFFEAFADVSVDFGDVDDVVGTHVSDGWVLDAFRWRATHTPSQLPVTLTDYVLLQYEDDRIVRSITFKNGAAVGRQLGAP